MLHELENILGFGPETNQSASRLVEFRNSVVREWMCELVRGDVDLIPCRVWDRLATSPALCHGIRTGSLTKIRECVSGELTIHCREHRDLWSALGDLWLGEAPPKEYASCMRLTPEGYWSSPRLSVEAAVDLSVGTAVSHPAAKFETDEPFVQCMTEDAAQLADAIAFLRDNHEPFACLIDRFVSNVVLYRDKNLGTLRSSTNAAAIGRVLIVNAVFHSTIELAEALVHESIHIAASCCELHSPLMNSDFATNTVVSPWTGARIPLHALAHAVFVWAALRSFRIYNNLEHTQISSGFCRLFRDGELIGELLHALHPPSRQLVLNVIEDNRC